MDVRTFENENQPDVFLHKVLLRPPQVMGRPRLRVKDVCAKTSISCALSDGVNVFGLGGPPGYPPGRPRDIPPKNLCFGFSSLPEIWRPKKSQPKKNRCIFKTESANRKFCCASFASSWKLESFAGGVAATPPPRCPFTPHA